MKADSESSKHIEDKLLLLIMIILIVLLLAPVVYLSGADRASGDDLSYGAYTHIAVVNSESFFEAVSHTMVRYYEGWQGTWFSIFLFSIQPEVFSNRAYFVVPIIMLILWGSSTFFYLRTGLSFQYRINKIGFYTVFVFFWMINLEFIPGYKSSVFWWNGCAHYMVPFTMCQFLMALLIRIRHNIDDKCIWEKVIVVILAFLLGGASYQPALLALGTMLFMLIYALIKRVDKLRWLILPVVLEALGLFVSIIAPGNKARGGENFGFSVSRIFSTIVNAFIKSFTYPAELIKDKPVIIIMLLILFIFLWAMFSTVALKNAREGNDEIKGIKKWIVLGAYLLYCAMYMPELYAEVEVSQGVGNIYFQTFMLFMLLVMIFASQKLALVKPLGLKAKPLLLLVAFVLILPVRENLKSTLSYVCYDYIISGQAADYKEQMEMQDALLATDEKNVVLPGINDYQGPLMSMSITEDKSEWINEVNASFYNKESVVSIPREQYMELYGE